jgi:uncharacterized repeat protein (TIGR03806 family)
MIMTKQLLRLLFVLFFGFTAFSAQQPTLAPPGAMGPYLNGIFPEKTPGATGAWTLEEAYTWIDIASPVRIIPFPGSDDLLVLSKIGELWRVSLDNQTQQLVLDIKDRSFKEGEAGTTGIALHPEFGNPDAPDKQLAFVFYRYKPNPDSWDEKGFNRLSRFSWDEAAGAFDADTEEILFQQYDRSTWHNGGGMFFHPDDGFLYLAVGDEGHTEFIGISNQRLDRALFGGLLRIDVDNDPSRSHPIRRQPQPSEWGPQDPSWGDTYSQGYSIPNDNPWQSPDSSLMEEFYAIGIRSPYSTDIDPVTGNIWLADVGEVTQEEISLIENGDNLQWPYMEGVEPSEEYEKPDQFFGNEKAPIHAYGRDFGGCIIGGAVYRGNRYPNLYGKYLFADYIKGRIMTLEYDEETGEVEREILIYNIEALGVNLPGDNGITGIFPLPNGEILVSVLSTKFKDPGRIFRLKVQEITPDPPSKLSDLGVFTDMSTLEVAPGIIPYTVNSPLWSDGAAKRRWMAIPNDGDYDTPEERILFSNFQDWGFPEGTVFIKHFELPISEDPEETIPLETRFFILAEEGRGYGLTYKWNEDGTDATLLLSDEEQEYTLYENDVPVGSQIWSFPSRGDCLDCHTSNANYVLGVKTHQLNGDYTYPGTGITTNQLTYLSDIGVLSQKVAQPDNYPRAYPIDDESVSLSLRIRSYLDANCSSCHRLGGVQDLSLDLRFQVPLHLQNVINQPTRSSNSDPNRPIVKPGDHASSEIWVRDASLTSNQMPPLARSIIDEVYIDKLAEWIDNLPTEAGVVRELVLYPNPTGGWLGIRISDDWQGPFQAQIYNIKGQMVRSLIIDAHSYFLDMTTEERGTYILKLSSGGEQEVRRFVLK